MNKANSVKPENFHVLQALADYKGTFSTRDIHRLVSCRPIRIITTSFSFFRSKGWLEYADPTLRACKGVKMRKTKRFPDLKTISVRVPKQPVVASNGYVPQKLSPLEARYRAFRDAIPMPLTVEDALTLHGRQ